MTGCLKLVGQGRWSADDLSTALAARNRSALGLNAPPDGLTFVTAHYDRNNAPNFRNGSLTG
jgi:tRNA pseudouridine38-40 synthase